tara:strand:+ start:352 stop:1545 length:1194 start_codon:yes stop_codon:yes gene_type:complete
MNLNNYRNAQASAVGRTQSLSSGANQRYDNALQRANSVDLATSLEKNAATEHINMAFNTINEGIIGKAAMGEGTKFLTNKLKSGVMNKILRPAGSRIVDYAKGDATFGEDMKNLPGKLQDGLKGLDAKVQEFDKTYGQGARKAGSSTQDIVEDIGQKFRGGISKIKDAVSRGNQFIRNQTDLGNRSLGSINGDPDAGGHIVSSDSIESGGVKDFNGNAQQGMAPKDVELDEMKPGGTSAGTPVDEAGGIEEAAEEGGNVVIGDAEEVAGVAGRRVVGQGIRAAGKTAASAASDAAQAAMDAVSDIGDVAKVASVAADGADAATAALAVVDVADAAVPGLDVLTDALTLGAAGAGFGLEKLADWIEKKTGGNTDSAAQVIKAVSHSTSQAGQLLTQQA